MEKRKEAGEKRAAFRDGVKPGIQKTGRVLEGIFGFFYRYRKIFMAIPVIAASLYLARYTGGRLPQNVGLFIQANGQYLLTVSRQTAVLAPMVITGSCLLLMFSSRRALYPWLISIFTLVIPYFMLASTVFPG